MVLYGFDQVALAVLVLIIVGAIDVLIYLATPSMLTCYNCQADYRGVKIPRGQKRWEAALAERYRRPSPPSPDRR